MNWLFVVCAVIGYFLGGLNGAIIWSGYFYKDDVRTCGSGNAGLTNFIRKFVYGTPNRGWGIFWVAFTDSAKVILTCIIARLLCPQEAQMAQMIGGIAAVMGHIYQPYFLAEPTWFKDGRRWFKGGKGIISQAALVLMLDWRLFLVGFTLFWVLLYFTDFVSVGSIFSSAVFAVGYWICFPGAPILFKILGSALACFTIISHHTNIKRLCTWENGKCKENPMPLWFKESCKSRRNKK